jgi:hypothetical protein
MAILMPSQGAPVFPTNKVDNHDITEVLLIVALNTNNHYTNSLVTFLFYSTGVTTSEQTEIVNQHNTYRRSTAATDMNMMVSMTMKNKSNATLFDQF